MDTFEKLDKVDLQILRTLQENARLTTKELAARVSLSSTPVFERLKRLESGGYIKKYIAVLDAEKLNQGFVVFCSVKLRRLNRDIAAEFTRIIQDIPEVTECYNISGSYDYLLKIHAPNMKYYQEFILNVLGTIDSLGSLESTFVMAEEAITYWHILCPIMALPPLSLIRATFPTLRKRFRRTPKPYLSKHSETRIPIL
jgi:Lrp/AsnC family transcriptional regulator, leucine-responsive regulatory protein